jgi:hypothetical protein
MGAFLSRPRKRGCCRTNMMSAPVAGRFLWLSYSFGERGILDSRGRSDRIELDSLLTRRGSSGGLVRINNDLIANTTAIASEDRMENRMPLVWFDEGKAHGLYTTWTDWRTYR